MPSVLVAPDTFKGTLTAAEVAAHVTAGLLRARPDARRAPRSRSPTAGTAPWRPPSPPAFDRVPVTVERADRRAGAHRVRAPRHDGGGRTGRRLRPGALPGGVPAPLTASSPGFGQVVAARPRRRLPAAGAGASAAAPAPTAAPACSAALGARMLDTDGAPVPPGGGGAGIHRPGRPVRSAPRPGRGRGGAGQRRGQPAARRPWCRRRLRAAEGREPGRRGPVGQCATDLVRRRCPRPRRTATASGHPAADTAGAGAAGGVGFAAIAVLARHRPTRHRPDAGAHRIRRAPGRRRPGGHRGGIAGRADPARQGPGRGGRRRRAAGVPVVAVAGRNLLSEQQLRDAGVRRAYALTDIEPDVQRCIDDPGRCWNGSAGTSPRTPRLPRHLNRSRPFSQERVSPGGDATSQYDVVFRGRRVITPAGERPAAVAVGGGRIAAIEPYDADLTGARTVDLDDDEVLLPGLVDTHVHVNEPGRTEWEGFATATRAAAAGGVTTIIDMPLNSLPPTIDVAGAADQAGRRRRDRPTSTSASGAARSPATSAACAALHDAGRVRLQVLPARLRRATSSRR